MERWWCIDCRTSVELNTQAKCECCGSDAVDTMERIGEPGASTIQPDFTPEMAGELVLPSIYFRPVGYVMNRILDAVL